MTDLFLKIFNISLSAVWIVCGVLAVRLVFRRAPKWVFPLLWGLVGLRLLMPTLPESSVSLLPSAEPVPESVILSPSPAFHTQYDFMDDAVNPIVADSLTPDVGDSVNPMQVLVYAGSLLWCAGLCLTLVYAAVSTIRLRLHMRTAVKTEDGIYRTDRASTPFILGVLRPRIYVPFSVPDASLPHVLAHERAHIRRRDHWIKPASFLLLAVHWFNPFLWLAYVLLCRDIELACDERVIRACTPEERAGYSEALLACSAPRHLSAALCPLAFGEVGVKARVKSVLSYKKPAFWILVLSLTAAAVLAVCFLTVPRETRNPAVGEYIPGVSVGNVDKAAFEEISPDFAIGADRNGYAVFVHPDKAFSSFRTLYADELALLRERHQFPPFSKSTWLRYKKAGIEEVGETDAQTERLRFVSRFLDIWENSLGTPSRVPASSTEESSDSLWRELAPDEVDESLWERARFLADARSAKLLGDRVLLRTDRDGVDHYIFRTKEPGAAIVLPDMEEAFRKQAQPAADQPLWIDEPEDSAIEVRIPMAKGSLTSAMGEAKLRGYIKSVVGQYLLQLAGGDPSAVRDAEVTRVEARELIMPAENALGEGFLLSCSAAMRQEDGQFAVTVPDDLYMTFVCAAGLAQSISSPNEYIATVFNHPASELESRTSVETREKYPDIFEAVLREDFSHALNTNWSHRVRAGGLPLWKWVWSSHNKWFELFWIEDESLQELDEGLLAAFLTHMDHREQQLFDKSLWESLKEGRHFLEGAELLGEESFTGSTIQGNEEWMTVQLWRLDFAWDADAIPEDAADGVKWKIVGDKAVPTKEQLLGILVLQTSDGPVYHTFGADNVTTVLWYLTDYSYRKIQSVYGNLKAAAGR